MLLACMSSIVGCGTQFTDPILGNGAPAKCPPGYVMRLDGASYGTMTRLIQDDFTIEAWIEAPSSPKGQFFADGSAIVFADVEGVQVDDFASATLNSKFVMSIGGPDTAATSTSDVTTNHWVHVAATRTRATGIVLVFVNGVVEGSAVANNHSLGASTTINIGGRAGRNFYTGLMSEVRLWRTVRSQGEIVANMHRRLNGNDPGLVGYYRLDENSGASAHDSSPSANDAVFTGPVNWVTSDAPLCDPSSADD
jgi:hypothetical protein